MGISTMVQWWEEWQLRILVVQWLLFISAIRRKHVISYRSIRSFIWLMYVGSDFLAIYALAALFNRQWKQDYAAANNRSILELVWVPILLMHLGGQDCITAYNIEDNELWGRHVLTAVSQITMAIYVFYKSCPIGGDRRLLHASILVFIPGILKCLEKPWALQSASINSLVSSSDVPALRTDEIEDYVKKAKGIVDAYGQLTQAQAQAEAEPQGNVDPRSLFEIYRPSKLFVDLASSYDDRIATLQSFWVLDKEKAYDSLQLGIYATFDLLYTKIKMTSNIFSLERNSQQQDPDWLHILATCVRFLAYILSLIAMGLIQSSDAESYDENDVKVTYVLLCCTVVLEPFSFLMSAICALTQVDDMENLLGIERSASMVVHSLVGFFGSNQMYNIIMPIVSFFFGGNQMHTIIRTIVSFFRWGDSERSSEVAQYSLVGFFGINQTRHKNIRPIVSFFKCEDLLYKLWCMQPCRSSEEIAALVVEYVKKGWTEEIDDVASYRKFNNRRGHGTLGANNQHLGWSVRRPFDESVLLWHIATDVCFYRSSPPHHETSIQCRVISQYMMYLLFVNPEMLLASTRRNLFVDAYDELEKIFQGQNQLPIEITDNGIINFLESEQGSLSQNGFFHGAMALADALHSIGDEKKVWEVIQGVWVEMLCYSASRSRGYLHAKSLGTGGEFLTYVWLLLSHMGMMTLPERLQRAEMEIPSKE